MMGMGLPHTEYLVDLLRANFTDQEARAALLLLERRQYSAQKDPPRRVDGRLLRARNRPEKCLGCGACVEICPVAAIRIENELAHVGEEWCIGCGVCATRCELDAFGVRYRKDQAKTPPDFETLQQMIHNQHGKG